MQQSDPVEHYGSIVGLGITVFAFLWALIRFLLRPLLDAIVFEAWKRKAPEAEKFMRDEMFKRDIDQIAELRRIADEGLQISHSNLQAIGALTAQQSRAHAETLAMHTLLAGIPHLAGTIEELSDSLDRMHLDLKETNKLARLNGETLAAHSALLGERRIGDRRGTSTGD